MTQEEQLRRIGQQLINMGYAHSVVLLVKPGGQVTMLADHKMSLTPTQSSEFCHGLLELCKKQFAGKPEPLGLVP